jgi:putative hydrolase of the HAD superfamily
MEAGASGNMDPDYVSRRTTLAALRAVVFDYGKVLSEDPHPEAYQELLRITGLPEDEFESRYWVDRLAYDRGDLTGPAYWAKLVADAGLDLSTKEVAQLNASDVRMWTSINERMVAWHKKLKERGLKTAILSNMGDSVMERILEIFAWVEEFDVLVWSFQHRMIKPDAAIYQLALNKLGAAPEETLFLDDKLENIEAARQLGIHGVQFSTVEQLREDLVSSGLDAWLPLP